MLKYIFPLLLLQSFATLAQTDTLTSKATVAKEIELQPPGKHRKLKGSFSFNWGYTRAWYSKSDIHFRDRSNNYHEKTGLYNNYDFTIYNAQATDRPDFDKIKDFVNFTIPQFVFRLSYYFNDKRDLGIEINYDHTKYIVDDGQRVHVKGDIQGQAVDKDTILQPNFLHFEHSDGANFLMLNIIKRWKLYEPSKKFNVGYIVKAGAGIVYPRTDVTMFGERLNNNWHVAGWIVGTETGIRSEFLKHGVFELTAKGSYADYTTCLVLGKGNGKAHHHFWAGQLIATLGFKFN